MRSSDEDEAGAVVTRRARGSAVGVGVAVVVGGEAQPLAVAVRRRERGPASGAIRHAVPGAAVAQRLTQRLRLAPHAHALACNNTSM